MSQNLLLSASSYSARPQTGYQSHMLEFLHISSLCVCLGVMKLEATKFRPREVVKHVLQTAAASLQKILTLEGHVADDVPIEVRVL